MPCIDDRVAPLWQRRPGRPPGRARPGSSGCAAAALLWLLLWLSLPLSFSGCAGGPAVPSSVADAATGTAVVPTRTPRYASLPPPPVSRSWDELKLNAARRLVAAHPDTSFVGPPPDPLLAIPVLAVELNADGSVRSIQVLREPRDVKETIQMAIDAVHRAAPYGDVSRLPRPWRFVEVFLFDDDRRFMPATLDR